VTAAVLTVSAAACGSASTTVAAPPSVAVTFTTSDGVALAGRLFGPSDARSGVVLSHMLPADQSSWYPEADRLAAQGYRVLTFDFRGYCPGGDAGCSQGAKDINEAPTDLIAALAFLRSKGPTRFALVGASIGGTASLVVASQQMNIPAVVTLSAPEVLNAVAAGPPVLASITGAKLFIAGLGDPTGSAQAAQDLYANSPQPKRLEIVPVDDHGTDLLTGGFGTQVQGVLEAWLAQYLHPGSGT
jgi:alpha-beta hydrolase superfamily lysophospholipase